MDYSFYGCSSLKSLPDISKWDTGNVIDMKGMFYGCSSLLSIPDLSKWNLNKNPNKDGMFYGCNNLSNISILFSKKNNFLNK